MNRIGLWTEIYLINLTMFWLWSSYLRYMNNSFLMCNIILLTYPCPKYLAPPLSYPSIFMIDLIILYILHLEHFCCICQKWKWHPGIELHTEIKLIMIIFWTLKYLQSFSTKISSISCWIFSTSKNHCTYSVISHNWMSILYQELSPLELS